MPAFRKKLKIKYGIKIPMFEFKVTLHYGLWENTQL